MFQHKFFDDQGDAVVIIGGCDVIGCLSGGGDRILHGRAESGEGQHARIVKAVAAGDKNVYFIDGETFYGSDDRDAFTIDRVHPNDAGMRAMADKMLPVLSSILYNE